MGHGLVEDGELEQRQYLHNVVPEAIQELNDAREEGIEHEDFERVTEHYEPINEGELQTFKILSTETMASEKFGLRHTEAKIQVHESVSDHDMGFMAAIVDAFFYLTSHYSDDDHVGLKICPANDDLDSEIDVYWAKKSQITSDMVLRQIENFSQSKREFFSCTKFTLHIPRVIEIKAFGNRFDQNFNIFSLKTSVAIQNSDEQKYIKCLLREANLSVTPDSLCLIYGLVLGMEYHNYLDEEPYRNKNKSERKLIKKEKDQNWRKARAQTSKEFATQVVDLVKKVDCSFANGANTNILNICQDILKDDYKITVFSGNTPESKIFGECYRDGDEKLKKIYLYFDEEHTHFVFLKNPAAAMGFKFYCEFCEKCFNNKFHDCVGGKCIKCEGNCRLEDPGPVPLQCSECNFVFLNMTCYKRHLDEKICDKRKICPKCCLFYAPERLGNQQHVCNSSYCRNCKEVCNLPHFCYISKNNPSPSLGDRDKMTFMCFADFEATQHVVISDANGDKKIHQVNVANSEIVCGSCRDIEFANGEKCEMCGPRQNSINNFDDPKIDVVTEFLNYLHMKCRLKVSDKKTINKDLVAIFFNLRSYDGCMILRNVLNNREWSVPICILNGLKIMKLLIVNNKTKVRITFLDFLNFMPSSLANLPKALNLEGAISKGHFPHALNRPEYYDYNEKEMPKLEFFGVDQMSEKDRKEVIEWHASEQKRMTENNLTYNFREQILAYCARDVEILRKSCLKYRSFFTVFGVECFLECITIASLVSLIIRRNF